MRHRVPVLALVAFAAAVAPPTLSAQSVAQVVERMYEVAERADGVDDYTVSQTMMAFSTKTYFEKEMVEGRPVFRARTTSASGMNMSLGNENTGYGDVFEFGPELIEHGRYVGRESIDGRETHVLAIDDLSALDLEPPSSPDESMDFEPKSGQVYVDGELWVPRRMAFEGVATMEGGETHDVTFRIDLMDVRDIQGLLIPHRTMITIDGFEAMVDPEMQQQLAEMEEQLANLPESQRAMVEQMLGPQIEQIKNMMSGDGGPMTMEIVVTDVAVNTGPPTG